jgi:hypothetical protein
VDNPQEKFKDFLPPGDSANPIKKFVSLLAGDCPENEDCDELLSPCCGDKMAVVFGSFPAEVQCKGCGFKMFLRELLIK